MKLLFTKAERGQAIIEFVMVFPLMAILLFATVDFGIALHQRHIVTEAVSQSARAWARDPNIDPVARAVDASGPPGNELLISSDVAPPGTIDKNGDGDSCDAGDAVAVEAAHQYNLITPLDGLLGLFGSGGPALNIELKARSEWPREVSVCP